MRIALPVCVFLLLLGVLCGAIPVPTPYDVPIPVGGDLATTGDQIQTVLNANNGNPLNNITVFLDPSASPFSFSAPLVFPDVWIVILQAVLTSDFPNPVILQIPQSMTALGSNTQFIFTNIVFDGMSAGNMMFDPPLFNNNATINSTMPYSCGFQNFTGTYAWLQEAGDPSVFFSMRSCYNTNIWGAAVHLAGMDSIVVELNVFDKCGGNAMHCLVLSMSKIAEGIFSLSHNQQWTTCKDHNPDCFIPVDVFEHVVWIDTDSDGTLELQCEDYGNHLSLPGCEATPVTRIDPMAGGISRTELIFPHQCREYRECVCQPVYFETASEGLVPLFIGDIIYSQYLVMKCMQDGSLYTPGDFLSDVHGYQPFSILDPGFDDFDWESGDTSGGVWTTNKPTVIMNAAAVRLGGGNTNPVIAQSAPNVIMIPHTPINTNIQVTYVPIPVGQPYASPITLKIGSTVDVKIWFMQRYPDICTNGVGCGCADGITVSFYGPDGNLLPGAIATTALGDVYNPNENPLDIPVLDKWTLISLGWIDVVGPYAPYTGDTYVGVTISIVATSQCDYEIPDAPTASIYLLDTLLIEPRGYNFITFAEPPTPLTYSAVVPMLAPTVDIPVQQWCPGFVEGFVYLPGNPNPYTIGDFAAVSPAHFSGDECEIAVSNKIDLTHTYNVPASFGAVPVSFPLVMPTAPPCQAPIPACTAVIPYTYVPNLAAYRVVNLSVNMTESFFYNNTASGLRYGAIIQDVTYDAIVRSSGAQIGYYDKYAPAREISKQLNALWGAFPGYPGEEVPDPGHTRILIDGTSTYQLECVSDCPIESLANINDIVTDPASLTGSVCYVNNIFDGLVTAGIYTTLQAALSDVTCDGKLIVVTNSLKPYLPDANNIIGGNVVFSTNLNTVLLMSYDDASIVGSIVLLEQVTTFLMRGFQHTTTGPHQMPAILIGTTTPVITNVTLQNNQFYGFGKQESGVWNQGSGFYVVDDFVFQYNSISGFVSVGLRLLANRAVIEDNLFLDITGTQIDLRYTNVGAGPNGNWYQINDNSMVGARASDVIDASVLLLITFVGTGNAGCVPIESCSLRGALRQLISNPFDLEDQQEIGIYVSGGQFNLDTCTNNIVRKAALGIVLSGIAPFSSGDPVITRVTTWVPLFMQNNPFIRPSATRLEGSTAAIDFTIERISTYSLNIESFTLSFGDLGAPVQRWCYVNVNFEEHTSLQFGWETFTNISIAADYCMLNTIQVYSFGGGRQIPDQFSLPRRNPASNDDILAYKAEVNSIPLVIIGSNPLPAAQIAYVNSLFEEDDPSSPFIIGPTLLLTTHTNPSVYGVNHISNCQNVEFYNLDFTIAFISEAGASGDFTNDNVGGAFGDIFSGSVFAFNDSAINLVFQNCVFDWRYITLPTDMDGLVINMGLTQSFQPGRQTTPVNTGRIVNATALIQDCKFVNVPFYQTIVDALDGSPEMNIEIQQFPQISVLTGRAINRASGYDNTNIKLLNVTFENIDAQAVDIRYFLNTNLTQVFGINTGGRAIDIDSAFHLEGNINSCNTTIDFADSILYQSRFAPFLVLTWMPQPAFEAMVSISGIPDTTQQVCSPINPVTTRCTITELPNDKYCKNPVVRFHNVSGYGLGFFLRLIDVPQDALARGLGDANLQLFGDELDLYRLISQSSNFTGKGVVHDIFVGAPYMDCCGQGVWCDGVCYPPDPTFCTVNGTANTQFTNPNHPWVGKFWFSDINTAIDTCSAVSGSVQVQAIAGGLCYPPLNATPRKPTQIQYIATYEDYALPDAIQLAVGMVTYPDSDGVTPEVPLFLTNAPFECAYPAADCAFTLPPQQLYPVASGIPPLAPNGLLHAYSVQIPPGIQGAPPCVGSCIMPNDTIITLDQKTWVSVFSVTITFDIPDEATTLGLSPSPSFAFQLTTLPPPFDLIAQTTVDGIQYAVHGHAYITDVTVNAELQPLAFTTIQGVPMMTGDTTVNPCIEGNGSQLNASHVTISDFTFYHAETTPGAATWEQPAEIDAMFMEFHDCIFDGQGFESMAIHGVFDNNMVLDGCSFGDYGGMFVVQLQGNACPADAAVSTFEITDNAWSEAPNNALMITCATEVTINSDNNFEGCSWLQFVTEELPPTLVPAVIDTVYVRLSTGSADGPYASLIGSSTIDTNFFVSSVVGEKRIHEQASVIIGYRAQLNAGYTTDSELVDTLSIRRNGFEGENGIQSEAAPICIRVVRAGNYFGYDQYDHCVGIRPLDTANSPIHGTLFDVVNTDGSLDAQLVMGKEGCEIHGHGCSDGCPGPPAMGDTWVYVLFIMGFLGMVCILCCTQYCCVCTWCFGRHPGLGSMKTNEIGFNPITMQMQSTEPSDAHRFIQGNLASKPLGPTTFQMVERTQAGLAQQYSQFPRSSNRTQLIRRLEPDERLVTASNPDTMRDIAPVYSPPPPPIFDSIYTNITDTVYTTGRGLYRAIGFQLPHNQKTD